MPVDRKMARSPRFQTMSRFLGCPFCSRKFITAFDPFFDVALLSRSQNIVLELFDTFFDFEVSPIRGLMHRRYAFCDLDHINNELMYVFFRTFLVFWHNAFCHERFWGFQSHWFLSHHFKTCTSLYSSCWFSSNFSDMFFAIVSIRLISPNPAMRATTLSSSGNTLEWQMTRGKFLSFSCCMSDSNWPKFSIHFNALWSVTIWNFVTVSTLFWNYKENDKLQDFLYSLLKLFVNFVQTCASICLESFQVFPVLSEVHPYFISVKRRSSCRRVFYAVIGVPWIGPSYKLPF